MQKLPPSPTSGTEGSGREAGDMIVFRGNSLAGLEGQQIKNIEFVNCTFWNPSNRDVLFIGCRDVDIHHCRFLDDRMDRKLCGHLAVFANTTPHYDGTSIAGDNTYRLSLHNNVFNGGRPVTRTINLVTKTYTSEDGILWATVGGGYHVADNEITNYALEGVQINCGPSTVVRNNYKADNQISGAVALVSYNIAQTADLFDGVGGAASTRGITSRGSAYTTVSFVDNSVQGGLSGVKASGLAESEADYAMSQHGAASDFVVSANTFNLADTPGATAVNFATVRNMVFAGNQVMHASLGVHWAADWNKEDSTHDYATKICKLSVMCNDFTGLSQFPLFNQGNFPLVDSVKFYANKMANNSSYSQECLLSASYWDSDSVHTFSGTKSKVAIVGNSYSGDPASGVALEASFVTPTGPYTSIELKDLKLNDPVPSITLHQILFWGDAPLFTDSLIRSLY